MIRITCLIDAALMHLQHLFVNLHQKINNINIRALLGMGGNSE